MFTPHRFRSLWRAWRTVMAVVLLLSFAGPLSASHISDLAGLWVPAETDCGDARGWSGFDGMEFRQTGLRLNDVRCRYHKVTVRGRRLFLDVECPSESGPRRVSYILQRLDIGILRVDGALYHRCSS